jgi:hypothetical protein
LEGTMVDRYTKIVLTIIACALAALVVQNQFPSARAQTGDNCGGPKNPCYVTSLPKIPVWVAVNPKEPLFVTTAGHPVDVKIVR